jgi:hypothetical protein
MTTAIPNYKMTAVCKKQHNDFRTRISNLVCETLKHAKKLCKVDLPVRELSTSRVVRPVKSSGTVDNQKRVSGTSLALLANERKRIINRQNSPALLHHRCCLNQKCALVVRVVCSRVCNVVQHFFAVEVVPEMDAEND